MAAVTSDIAEMRKQYNMAEWPALDPEVYDVHTVACTMKKYLKELPNPLLTAVRKGKGKGVDFVFNSKVLWRGGGWGCHRPPVYADVRHSDAY